MKRFGVAIDIGTSGIRAQAISLETGSIYSTAITTYHPIPGANIIDHLHFTLETRVQIAQGLLFETINSLIKVLNAPMEKIERVGICGNSVQLSLFQGIEIRDLAYTGKRKIENIKIIPPKRDATIIKAQDLSGLNLSQNCDIIIPPCIMHEIGADALAMIIKSGILEQNETALVTDYGTNAEMALFHDGQIIIGSTAAGSALEGQQISCGTLAMPGAISDIDANGSSFRVKVLDSNMIPVESYVVDIKNGQTISENNYVRPSGITGTGVIAIINQAIDNNYISVPKINTSDGKIHLGQNIFFTEDDLNEAGKAIGAIRAGHISLCSEAGINLSDVNSMYMAGATGNYLDVIKAQKIGLIPSKVKTIYKLGNTSLGMAKDLVMNPNSLDRMVRIANSLRKSYHMFASSEAFKKVYMLEISFWTEGMPISLYKKFLAKYGFSDLSFKVRKPEKIYSTNNEINELGIKGLTIISEQNETRKTNINNCTLCMKCVENCPNSAISIFEEKDKVLGSLVNSNCLGTTCKKCERVCPHSVLHLYNFFSNKA